MCSEKTVSVAACSALHSAGSSGRLWNEQVYAVPSRLPGGLRTQGRELHSLSALFTLLRGTNKWSQPPQSLSKKENHTLGLLLATT